MKNGCICFYGTHVGLLERNSAWKKLMAAFSICKFAFAVQSSKEWKRGEREDGGIGLSAKIRGSQNRPVRAW